MATISDVSDTPDTPTTHVSRSRHRLRQVDPLIGLSCAVALVVYLLHGFDGFLTRDLGVYSYGGQQMAEGVLPYVAILNRAGPLAHVVPGIGAAVAGWVNVDDVLGMRVLFMLISVACVGLAYVLGRDTFRSRLAGLATAATLLCFEGFIRYATYGPREKTTMVLFLVCALLAVVHQRWLTTGAFIALATLTWQPVFFAAIAGAVVALLLGQRTGRLLALLRLGVGGLIPTALTVGTYAALGHLQVFLDDFLLINARYTDQTTMLEDPETNWRLMVQGYGGSLWVFFVGLAALLVLSLVALVRRDRREPANAALVGSGAVLVGGVLWSFRAFNGWPDVFFLLPVAALGIGGVAAALARWLPARAALAATVAWSVAATTLAVTYSVGHRDDTLDGQRADVEAVLALLPADARILSVEAPEALVLAHERTLSRYQLFGNGLVDYVDDTYPGGSAGYGRWIAEQEPTVIAFGGLVVPEWLTPTLQDAYQRVGRSTGWVWYVREDLGRPTLSALRAELHDRS
jgi:4-amino-4-deoxy-L-arabinose transferase-like glycosyltransferase